MAQDYNIPGEQEAEDNRRRHGRRLQESLWCSLGEVLDLSAGGMRVLLATKVTEETFHVSISSLEGTVTVKARIAWTKRRGITRKREVGLQFLDVDEKTTRMLTRISSTHRVIQSRAA